MFSVYLDLCNNIWNYDKILILQIFSNDNNIYNIIVAWECTELKEINGRSGFFEISIDFCCLGARKRYQTLRISRHLRLVRPLNFVEEKSMDCAWEKKVQCALTGRQYNGNTSTFRFSVLFSFFAIFPATSTRQCTSFSYLRVSRKTTVQRRLWEIRWRGSVTSLSYSRNVNLSFETSLSLLCRHFH